MHTITSLKELINKVVSSAPNPINDKRGYNKSVKEVQNLRQCLMILQSGTTKERLIGMKDNLAAKVEACLSRIDSETRRYKLSNKQVPSKVIKAIKDDFGYSLALNQIKSINFILNEKSVQ